MKVCVFITGTNAVGKTTLAKSLIEHFGGVLEISNDVTYCAKNSVCLAGKYDTAKYGGVDRILNEKKQSCTSRLPEVVGNAFQNANIIFCEGSRMNTFGLNLTNAIFQADKQLLVSLYADPKTIFARLEARSESKNGKRNCKEILRTQRNAMLAARKFHKVGVPVLQYNTAEISIDELKRKILLKINEICGENLIETI